MDTDSLYKSGAYPYFFNRSKKPVILGGQNLISDVF